MRLAIKELVIKIDMKKTILISIAILAICGSSCCYLQSDKKMIYDFASEVVDNTVEIDDVVAKYIKCDKMGKEIAIIFLNHFRKGYAKNTSPESIKIQSYKKAMRSGTKIGIIAEDYDSDKVFYIYFKDSIKMPILLNDESKIIAISFGLNKGGDINYFMRLDGEK